MRLQLPEGGSNEGRGILGARQESTATGQAPWDTGNTGAERDVRAVGQEGRPGEAGGAGAQGEGWKEGEGEGKWVQGRQDQ